MGDDKMKNDQEKNLGGKTGSEGQGQQAPGRNPQDDQSTGERPGQGQKGGQRREDEDFENRPGQDKGAR